MTDFMLLGILRMPIEADDGVVAFTQFRSAARSAADRIEQLTAERDARIDPAEVQALINAAEPMLATALASAEAERDRLRAKLADAALALDAAGMELSDFANCLSREPWAAGLAYEAAIDARSVMKGETP